MMGREPAAVSCALISAGMSWCAYAHTMNNFLMREIVAYLRYSFVNAPKGEYHPVFLRSMWMYAQKFDMRSTDLIPKA